MVARGRAETGPEPDHDSNAQILPYRLIRPAWMKLRFRTAVKKSPPKRANTIHHEESVLRQECSFRDDVRDMMCSRMPCQPQPEAKRSLPFVLASFEINVAVVISYWVPER